MSNSRVKPVETPWTALAARARVSPCSAACWSEARLTSSLPVDCSKVMPSGIGTRSLPLGPVTSNCAPTLILTPLGSGIGFLPILDIAQTSLPDTAEDFPADVFLVRVAPGHDAARSGQDVDSHASEHARDIGLADVHAAPRPRHALDLGAHRRVAGTVLKVNLDGLLRALFGHFEVGNIAFFLENARDFRFQLGGRHVHLGVAGLDRVAYASQHVGNGIACHNAPKEDRKSEVRRQKSEWRNGFNACTFRLFPLLFTLPPLSS